MTTPPISDTQRQELTLLLLHLFSWKEDVNTFRAWKGHDFGTLDALIEQDFISGDRTSKSVYFTEEGRAKALELVEKYLNGQ